jgi:hypothetical protein
MGGDVKWKGRGMEGSRDQGIEGSRDQEIEYVSRCRPSSAAFSFDLVLRVPASPSPRVSWMPAGGRCLDVPKLPETVPVPSPVPLTHQSLLLCPPNSPSYHSRPAQIHHLPAGDVE